MLYRASSGANGGMSVDINQLIEERGILPDDYVKDKPWMGAISLGVGSTRELGFEVGYNPLSDNPFHGEIWGQFARAQQKALAQNATWCVEIPGVSLAA